MMLLTGAILILFLSTLSLRRATMGRNEKSLRSRISIHALLAESDPPFYDFSKIAKKFLSTLSLRRATIRKCQIIPIIQISIHALLAESDIFPPVETSSVSDFYPRSPCGERQIPYQRKIDQKRNFYPRSPCGERQDANDSSNANLHFYPRSPCGERQG